MDGLSVGVEGTWGHLISCNQAFLLKLGGATARSHMPLIFSLLYKPFVTNYIEHILVEKHPHPKNPTKKKLTL